MDCLKPIRGELMLQVIVCPVEKKRNDDVLVIGQTSSNWNVPMEFKKEDKISSYNGMIIDCNDRSCRFILVDSQAHLKPGDKVSISCNLPSVPKIKIVGEILRVSTMKTFLLKKETLVTEYSFCPDNINKWSKILKDILPEFKKNQEKYIQAKKNLDLLVKANAHLRKTHSL